jgi:hypothetical protein
MNCSILVFVYSGKSVYCMLFTNNTLLLNIVYSDSNSIFDFIAVYVRYYGCIPGFDSCSLHDAVDYCICIRLYGRADKLD